MIREYSIFPSFDIEGAGEGGAGGAAPAAEGGAGQPGEGAGPTDPAGAPGGQPAAGAPTDPEHEVTVDGKVVKVKLSELTSGYSRHSDYTTKTQALAQRQRDLETDYQTRLTNLEAMRRQLQGGGQPQPGEGEGEPDANSEIAQMKEQLADDKLDRTLRELAVTFPALKEKHNEDAFCMMASQRGVKEFRDLHELAKEFTGQVDTRQNSLIETTLKNPEHPAVKAFREAVIADYLKSKGGTPAPGTGVGGGPAPQIPAQGAKKWKSADERDDAAMAALQQAGV